MAQRRQHLGADAFLAQKKAILDAYDKAKIEATEDAVMTEHGVSAEATFRHWLNRFLPKRFSATKGYIITTNLDYEGPMEEWDIIIFDALEAPVLFTRGAEGGEAKQAIPVESVRSVIEVKATLTPKHAKQVADKLLKLRPFIGVNEQRGDPMYVPRNPVYIDPPFVSAAVFFETKVSNLNDYRRALDELARLYQAEFLLGFMGALVLRSERAPKHSGYLQGMHSLEQIDKGEEWELSSPFVYPYGTREAKWPDGTYPQGAFGCLFWYESSFPLFIFDLLAGLKGKRYPGPASRYGLPGDDKPSRLFH